MSSLRIVELTSHGLGPVSFSLDSECVCVSGPSGAGKTLLLRALADLDPHRGQVWLDEMKCTGYSGAQWRRQVGYLAAESQWWRSTVGEHFADIDNGSLQHLGFGREVLTWQISRLSSGERARLGLLRLLSRWPKVLLLDEPTANLDTHNTHAVEQLITAYHTKQQAAVLWVSHDPAQIARVAERHLLLAKGRLIPGGAES